MFSLLWAKCLEKESYCLFVFYPSHSLSLFNIKKDSCIFFKTYRDSKGKGDGV